MVREIMESLETQMLQEQKVERDTFKNDLVNILAKHLRICMERAEMVYSGTNILELEDAMNAKNIGINRFANTLSQAIDEYVASIASSGQKMVQPEQEPQQEQPAVAEPSDNI